MGNGQSAEAPRRPPNKLSKPRTNNHSTASLATKSGPPSRRNSQLNHGSTKRHNTLSVDAVGGEAERGEELTKKKRMSMFRSKSARPHSEPLHINTGTDPDFRDYSSQVDRWSRRGSFTESPAEYYAPAERPPARPARMSLQHSPYAQHHPRLSLVAEALSPQPDPEPRREVSKRRSTNMKEEESPQTANTLPARANSEADLYTPMRRRSLQQHGIATRKSWVENDPPMLLPSHMTSQDDLQNYYYNPAKPTSSPLSDLVALARLEGVSPAPRTMTPDDLDYRHIGAFKLGSLRITNGAASPAPSIDGRPATREGDYLERDHQGSPHSHRSGLGQRSHTISVPQETIRPPWIMRAESPLRQMVTEPEPEPQRLTVNTHLPLLEFSAFNFDPSSPTKSLELAHEYMQDLALSPFSFDNSPPLSPTLQTTSKHTAMEDDLFEPEPGTPEASDIRPPRSFDSGYPAEEADATKGAENRPRDLAPMGLTKADSGYSSNVSLRSFKGKGPTVPAKEAPPAPPKEPVSRAASSAYSSYSTASEVTLQSKRSLPALPREEMPPQPFRQPPPVPLKHSSVHTSAMTTPAPPLPSKSPAAASSRAQVVVTPKQLRKKSMPSMTQPVKDESTRSSLGSTGSSNSSITSRWRKDKKQRPQPIEPQQQVFTVQAIRSTSEGLSIPPVPVDVSRNLEKRVDGFPVTCFPNTLVKTDHLRKSVSRETLGTIFSVGSAEWREEAIFARLQSALPPVPVEATIPENPCPSPKPEANRRYTYQPSSPAPHPYVAGRNQQSMQAIPRKVSPIQREVRHDFENHITSYENASSRIGQSPSDVAIGPIAKRPTAQERAKSMTSQLEAEAAARFARARSVSQDSNSTIIRRISYESISNANPFSLAPSYNSYKPRERPPPAHAKYTGIGTSSDMPPSMLVSRRSSPNLVKRRGEVEERRFSLRSQLSKERMKSPPPISMQTQRAMHVGSQIAIPPSRAYPIAPQEQPNRPAYPPAPSSIPRGKEEQHPQAKQSNLGPDVQKGAGETMQQGTRGCVSARPSFDHWRPQAMKSHSSWDTSQQRWDGYGGQYGTGDYHHTYNSYEHNKENWAMNGSQHVDYIYDPLPYEYAGNEYYDSPSSHGNDNQNYQQRPEQAIYQRQTSTPSMLVLDRFSGGLDYGYEPGLGLGGSAGTRNTGKLAAGRRKSVDVSVNYGLDFSDVPVFLQRVKVEA